MDRLETHPKPYGMALFSKTIFFSFILILSSCKGKVDNRQGIISIDSTSTVNSKLYIEPDTTNAFTALKDQSKLENKNIFLLFSFKACGFCRIFEKYHNDSMVKSILNKYIIVADIDVDHTKGGNVLYAKYGKIGFPSWSIVDFRGKVIADSEDREGNSINVGYPDTKTELAYYANALKNAAPEIKYSELSILIEKLKYFRN